MANIEPTNRELQGLLADINDRKLAIPEFQRKYEWKLDDVKKLLDSILHNYPIGSLLFLGYKDQMNMKNIEGSPDLTGKDENGEDLPIVVEELILDGQQRLTSTYQALYGKHKGGHFFLDLKKLYEAYICADKIPDNIDYSEAIVTKKVKKKDTECIYGIRDDLLPFNLLIAPDSVLSDSYSQKVLSYRETLKNTNADPEYIAFIETQLDRIIDPMITYNVPVLKLSKSLSMSAICRIFETLNTTGKNLDSFDICVAKFYGEFKIRTELSNKLEKVDEYGVSKYPYLNIFMSQNANRVYVLQVIALIVGKPHSKNSLPQNLEAKDIKNSWDNAIDAIEMALRFMDSFGACTIRTLGLIPYLPAILVISAALVKSGYVSNTMPIALVPKVPQKIRKYFFYTALDLRYGEGAMTKTEDDAQALNSWLTDDEKIPEFMKKPAAWYLKDLLTLEVGSKGARINMIRCLMNYKHPKDFATGEDITSISEKMDLHHIFPEATYAGKSPSGYSVDSVFNKTYIIPDTNRRIIRDETTKEFIPDLTKNYHQNNEKTMKQVLSDHFINDTAYQALLDEDYDKFVEARADQMFDCLKDEVNISIGAVSSVSEDEEIKMADDKL